MKQTLQRAIHWLAVLAFAGLFVTEIINQYFFSKEAILRSFEFSFTAVGLQDVPMVDRLFIAKLLRRTVWIWHFWFGVSFVTLTILRVAVSMYLKDFKHIGLQLILMVIISVMFATGLPLWLRAFETVNQSYQDIARMIHHYTVYLLWAVISGHIIQRIIQSVKEKNIPTKDEKNILLESSEYYFGIDKTIPFCNNETTVFLASCRSGKTYRMINMAEQCHTQNKPFLYIITTYHIDFIQRDYNWVSDLITAVPLDFSELKSAFIIIGDRETDILDENNLQLTVACIREAIKNGYHIFIDEARHHYRHHIMKLLLDFGYKNWTLSAQGLSAYEHLGVDMDLVAINHLYVGKTNDITSRKTTMIEQALPVQAWEIPSRTFFEVSL